MGFNTQTLNVSERSGHVFGRGWRFDNAEEQTNLVILLQVAKLAEGFGSRESVRKVRHVVENAIDNDRKFVALDFQGVEMCSSSFIDELLVKLLAKYGTLTYPNVFKVVHLKGLPAGLANFSAAHRIGPPCSR